MSPHILQIEAGLTELYYACVCLDNLIGNNGTPECSAVLALIQKAGGLLETALRDAAILKGPAVVGMAENWLRIGADMDGGEA